MKTIMAVAAFALATDTLRATPLRELIFQTMEQEHPGVLTSAEITTARKLGAQWHREHPHYYEDVNPTAAASARKKFQHDEAKRKEWALEWVIGNMMASEAEFWTP